MQSPQPMLQNDVIVSFRLRRTAKKNVYLLLYPVILVYSFALTQQMLGAVVIFLHVPPVELLNHLAHVWWRLPLYFLGVSSDPSLQSISRVLQGLFTYFLLIAFACYQQKCNISDVLQWRNFPRILDSLRGRAQPHCPFSIKIPSWLDVIAEQVVVIPSAILQPDYMRRGETHIAEDGSDTTIDSTLVPIHEMSALQTILPTATLPAPRAEAESSHTVTSVLPTEHEQETQQSFQGIMQMEGGDVAFAEKSIGLPLQKAIQAVGYFLLVLHQNASIFFKAVRDETEVLIEVTKNPIYQAIIAFLASHKKGPWVKRSDLMKIISEDQSQKTAYTFNQAMQRFKQMMQKVAEQEGFPLMLPFEQKYFGQNDSHWRLSDSWKCVRFDILEQWYKTIKDWEFHPENEKHPSIKALRAAAKQLIEEYTGGSQVSFRNASAYRAGLLVECLELAGFGAWAMEEYKCTRDKYISVLSYIARQECAIAQQPPRQPRRQQKCWTQAARLYWECILAATCVSLDGEQGEQALRECITLYMRLKQRKTAERVCKIFKIRVERLSIAWEPEPETVKLLTRHRFLENL